MNCKFKPPFPLRPVRADSKPSPLSKFNLIFSGVMRCSTGKDTGCGDVDDVTGNSAMACANNVCSFTCPADKFHYGVTAATCTIVNGTRTITYDMNLHPEGVTDTRKSQCGDTMCGDLSTLGVDIDPAVAVNMSVGTDGYGSIFLECANPNKVNLTFFSAFYGCHIVADFQ